MIHSAHTCCPDWETLRVQACTPWASPSLVLSMVHPKANILFIVSLIAQRYASFSCKAQHQDRRSMAKLLWYVYTEACVEILHCTFSARALYGLRRGWTLLLSQSCSPWTQPLANYHKNHILQKHSQQHHNLATFLRGSSTNVTVAIVPCQETTSHECALHICSLWTPVVLALTH